MRIKPSELTLIIQAGLEILMTNPLTLYSQKQIADKLKEVDKSASPAWLSRIKNGGSGSKKYLFLVKEGLCLIIDEELGFKYDYEQQQFVRSEDPDWRPTVIGEQDVGKKTVPFIFHTDGRRSISEKTTFIATARREVIFFGLRMRQFANYFASRRDGEFTEHIETLLARGVDVKCYLLDYTSNKAILYFQDLAEIIPQEVNAEKEIKDTLEALLKVKQKFDQAPYPGTFSIWTYRHLPSAHFLIVDGAAADAKMHASHYLYGQPSAKVPVLEVWRARSVKLYDLYWETAKGMMKGASAYGATKK